MYEDATGTPKEKINEMRRKLYAEKNGLEVDGEGYAIRKSSAKMKLPNQERLKIPMSKFTNYALDSPKAPDKARAFKEALGYDKSNVDELINQIESKLNEYEAKEKGDRGWGMTYEIIMDITGPNGKTAKVLTAWIDDSANNEMRLTTVHVDD
jgi:effector-binding domain-containing protein